MHTTISADAAGALADPLDSGAIEALVTGRHGSPFDVLGPHTQTSQGQRIWIVRAFLPGVRAAWVVPLAGGGSGALGDEGEPRGMNATDNPAGQAAREAAGLAPVFRPGSLPQSPAVLAEA